MHIDSAGSDLSDSEIDGYGQVGELCSQNSTELVESQATVS